MCLSWQKNKKRTKLILSVSRVSLFSGSVTSRQTDPNTTARLPFIIKMTTCHHTDLLSNTRSRCSSRALQTGTQLFWLYDVGCARSFFGDFLWLKSKTIRLWGNKMGTANHLHIVSGVGWLKRACFNQSSQPSSIFMECTNIASRPGLRCIMSTIADRKLDDWE